MTAVPGAESIEGASLRLTSETWRPGLVALRDAWFPVAHATQVGCRPAERAIHRHRVFLWRDERGLLRATETDPRTSSRQAGTELTGGSGSYSALERHGYAWVWYGNPENAHPELVPDVPYLPLDRSLPRHMWGTIFFDCAYELVCENLLDLSHGDMIHGWLLGDPFSEEDEITVDSTDETVTMTRVCTKRRTPPSQWAFCRSRTQDVVQVAHVHLRSGGVILSMRVDPPGLSVRLFHPNVPESPTRTRLSYAFNCDASVVYRNLFPLVAHIIGSQDNRMLRAQNPRYMQPSDRVDCSSRFDAAALRYRKQMKELANRQLNGDFSYGSMPTADAAAILRVRRVN